MRLYPDKLVHHVISGLDYYIFYGDTYKPITFFFLLLLNLLNIYVIPLAPFHHRKVLEYVFGKLGLVIDIITIHCEEILYAENSYVAIDSSFKMLLIQSIITLSISKKPT